MALQGPIGKDNLDISFRLHSKTHIFDGSTNALNNAKLNIVASASSLGLVFVGSTNAEIFVICTKDLELPTALNQNAPVRKIPMPSQVAQLATNCDGTLLAVDVKINGVAHIQIYSVPSFISPNIQKLREFRISSDNTSSAQLCWNPVINTILAVCSEGGALCLYSFKDQGVEFHTIDPSLKAKCCCWSPKGKQIVAGFMNGKLMQFNMELKPARTIECPPGIFQGGSFDVIAIQWLSTYQFAVAFLSHKEASRPVLHILNAPKAGPPQYIAYNDVCYSTSEVRPSKIYIQYIQSWGLILIASANCVDVSFLRITRPGDMPEWTQEFANDQYPAELPLTPEKDESFPVGFEFETGCTNKLLQEDSSPYPVMPMIHLVSTYGVMCSFYVVNTTPSYVDICSPPRPIDPRVQALFTVQNIASAQKSQSDTFKTPVKTEPAPISHSTPAVPKTNLFSSTAASFGQPTQGISFGQPAANYSFGQQSQTVVPPQNAFTGFGLSTTNVQQKPPSTGFQLNTSKPSASSPQLTTNQPLLQAPQTVPKSLPLLATPQNQSNQPLITVPPTYNPQQSAQKQETTKESSVNEKLSEAEDEKIYIKMIEDEIKAFELELNFLMDKSRSLKVNIGTKDESADMRRKLEELDELKKEATETIESLRSDVQTNRLGLTEMFSMVYEAIAKCDQSNNEKSIIMSQNQIQDRSIKRTLDKLKRMISQCEMQIHVVIQLLNSQWVNYQDTLSKNKKNKMHIPSLEGVYQTLTKQQEIIYNLSAKLKLLKSKLGICDDVNKQKNANVSATIESLSDSIISMSLIDQVQNEKSKLTEKKHKNLLNYLENRQVVTIKPQRPKLPGLNSEIIIEKKIKAMKSLKKPAEPKKTTTIPQQQKEMPKQAPQFVVPKSQPSESIFDFASSTQKSAMFTPVTSTTSSVQQPQLSFAKKPEEVTQKNTGFGFGNQQNFGINLSNTSVPSFGSSTGFTSSTLVANVEKKKEESVPKINLTPKPVSEIKPASTISNTNVSVSANFSVSLPAKSSPPAVKEPPKVEEKKLDEKPLTSNESTTFTFSLPGKKEAQSANKSGSAITFGTAPSVASDPVKSAFSFSGGSNAFSFANAAKTIDPKPATTNSASIFSGSSNVSFGFGDSNKPAQTSNIFASTTKVNEDTTKTVTTSSSPSLFGSSTADAKSSFSFASFGSAPISSTVSPASTIISTSSSILTPKSDTSITPVVTKEAIVSSTVSAAPSSSADSVLQDLKICSPTTDQTVSSTGNVFITPVSSTKSETPSVFGTSGNTFGTSSFGGSTIVTTKSSIFDSSSSSVTSTIAESKPQNSSIFAQAATTAFGGLDLSTKPASPNTQQGNIFGSSLVKPDQSVFGQPVTTSSSSPGAFSNIFAAAAANSAPKTTTNAFGNTQSPSIFSSSQTGTGNIFAQASQTPPSSVFGQTPTTSSTSIFGQTTTTSSGSIFSQTAVTTASSGSIFSSSSFTSPNTGNTTGSIFGGTTQTQQSAFGSGSSIFGSSGQQQAPQQTSSIFGGSNVFGAQTASAPSTNIFASAASGQNTSTSPFGGSNIFTQNQGSQPTFGGTASFGGGFGTSGGSIFSQQTQNQPVFGGAATFGSPKSNIFAAAAPSSPQSNQTNTMFEQLGQQSGNLFGSLAQSTQPPQQGGGFSGSAFSSWR